MPCFSARLKEIRTSKGIHQSELAKSLGMKGASVSKYELGYSQPDLDTLILIADYFEVSANYLLGLSDSPQDNISPYTDEEITLLELFKRLPAHRQFEVKGYISGILNSLDKSV